MNSESPWATKRPIPFKNVSGETIPAFAAMAITGLAYENGIAFLECDKPGTAFAREYAVNNIYDVPADRRGTCFRAGDLRVLYDSGTPAAGAGWGPKPGQWSLAHGFPGFTLEGVVHADKRIAKAFFEPITQVLAKTTASVGAGATTQSYRVYAGPFGSETDAGFTTVPAAHNRTAQSMDADEWAWLVWTNDGWELRCLQNRVYHVTYLGGGIAAGATGSVTLPDGRTVTATNWSTDTTIDTNDKCLCWQDFTNSAWYLVKSGGGGTDRVWYGTAVDPMAPGATGTVTKSDSTTPEATNWSDDVSIQTSDKIFIWLDSFDNNHYCIKSGGAVCRWFNATITGSPADLHSADASHQVTTYEALDGGAHPGVITGVNKYRLSGQVGDEVSIAQNLAAGTYQIQQVRHVVKTLVQNIDWTSPNLRKTTQDVTVMHEAAPAAPANILTAVLTEYVVDVNYNAGTNALSYDTRQALVFVDAAGTSGNAILTAQDIDVVTDVSFDAGWLNFKETQITVFEKGTQGSGQTIFQSASHRVITDVYMAGIDLVKWWRDAYLIEPSGLGAGVVFFGTLCPPGTEAGAVPFNSRAQQAAFSPARPFAFERHNYTRPFFPQ
ncbi:MAG: hypothetical protein WD063_02765 [Pirellulales bacterium]